ncbi:hypothetical protein [Paenibacillus sp. L3-i20]|uniref:hypothetical protein n=1 Tax=Paenibacillus sp. L3-i20 TaxID=2905833 RepID=UPI001EE0F365|nr:hypothetical protein [Paenibacillus sp. L3-i20]GKU76369.1 hypothetical protein L3i20_v207660 [Paenibacillus sp. L3-i20]
MNKYNTLLRNDIRQAALDPMLMACIFGPLMLILLARIGFPLAAEWLMTSYTFQLSSYANFAQSLFIATIPLLIGTLTGLLILDERDENLIAYFTVTPLTRRGYLFYRLLLPTGLTIILSTLFLTMSGLMEFRAVHLLALLLVCLEAPWFALLLAAFAGNKVEGIAFSKLGGLLIVGPIAVHFAPDSWEWLAAIIPTFWVAKMLEHGLQPLLAIGYGTLGLFIHVAMLWIMIKVFVKKID